MASVAQPATRKHALTFYNALVERATYSEEAGCLIFEGGLIEVFRSLGISNAYYSHIRVILTQGENPNISVIRPGYRGFASIVALHHAPDPNPDVDAYAEALTTRSRADKIGAADLERRLLALEEWRESLTKGGLNIVEALRNMELRLRKIESQTGGNGAKTP